MKFVVTLHTPPVRGSKIRASKKKECVEICAKAGVREIAFSLHGDVFSGKVLAGNGDHFSVTQATSAEVRVLANSLMRVARPLATPTEPDASYDPDLDGPRDETYDPELDGPRDDAADPEYDPDEGL